MSPLALRRSPSSASSPQASGSPYSSTNGLPRSKQLATILGLRQQQAQRDETGSSASSSSYKTAEEGSLPPNNSSRDSAEPPDIRLQSPSGGSYSPSIPSTALFATGPTRGSHQSAPAGPSPVTPTRLPQPQTAQSPASAVPSTQSPAPLPSSPPAKPPPPLPSSAPSAISPSLTERLKTQRAEQQAQRPRHAQHAQQTPPSPVRQRDCVNPTPPSPHQTNLSSPTSTASRRAKRAKRLSSEPEAQRKKVVEEEAKEPCRFTASERPQTGWESNADSRPFATERFSGFSAALNDAFGPGADVRGPNIDQCGWSPFADCHPIPHTLPRPHAALRAAPLAPTSPGHSHAYSPRRKFDPSSPNLSSPFSHHGTTRQPSVSIDVTLNEAAPRLITYHPIASRSSPRPRLPPSNPFAPPSSYVTRPEIVDQGEGEGADLWALREHHERAVRQKKLEWERARRETARVEAAAEHALAREEAPEVRTRPEGKAPEVAASAKNGTKRKSAKSSSPARGRVPSERAASLGGGTSPLEPREDEYVLFEGWLLLPPTSASALSELAALPPSSWIPHYVLLTPRILQLLPPTDGQPPAVALIMKECDSIDFAPELPIRKEEHFFPWAVKIKDGEKMWFAAGSGREWLSWTCRLRDAIDVAHGRPLHNPLDDSDASDSDANSAATLTSFCRSSRSSTAPTSTSCKLTLSKKGPGHLAELHQILADYEAGLAALGSSKPSSTRRPNQAEDWMRNFNRAVKAYPVMHELHHDAGPDDWSPTSLSKRYRPPTPAHGLQQGRPASGADGWSTSSSPKPLRPPTPSDVLREKSSPFAPPVSGLNDWSPRRSLDSRRPPEPGPSQGLRPDGLPLPSSLSRFSPLPPQSHPELKSQVLPTRAPLPRQPKNGPILPLQDAESLLHIFDLLKQRHDPVSARLGAGEEAIRAAGARLARLRKDLERKMRIEGGASAVSQTEATLLDKVEYLIHLNDARLKKRRRSISVEGRGSWVRPTSQQEADLVDQLGQRITEILEQSGAVQAKTMRTEMVGMGREGELARAEGAQPERSSREDWELLRAYPRRLTQHGPARARTNEPVQIPLARRPLAASSGGPRLKVHPAGCRVVSPRTRLRILPLPEFVVPLGRSRIGITGNRVGPSGLRIGLDGHVEQHPYRDEPEREWTHIEYLQALFKDVLAGFEEQQYELHQQYEHTVEIGTSVEKMTTARCLMHDDRKATKKAPATLARTIPAASTQLAALEATLAAVPPAPAPVSAPALAAAPSPAPGPAATTAQLPRVAPQSRHHLISGDGRMAAKVVPVHKAKEWTEGIKPVAGGGKKVAGVRLWGGPDPIPLSRHVPRWAEGATAAQAAREVFELLGSLQSESTSGQGKRTAPPIVEEMMRNERVQAALKGVEVAEGVMDPAAKALAIYEILHEAREHAKQQKAPPAAHAKKRLVERRAMSPGIPARPSVRVDIVELITRLVTSEELLEEILITAVIPKAEGKGKGKGKGKPKRDDKQTKQALVEILERWKPGIGPAMGGATEDLAPFEKRNMSEDRQVEELRQQQAELQARLATELKAKAEVSY
ncbi:hypothetical protein JCM21900_000551 [Sporobolomyces salmonicolor]